MNAQIVSQPTQEILRRIARDEAIRASKRKLRPDVVIVRKTPAGVVASVATLGHAFSNGPRLVAVPVPAAVEVKPQPLTTTVAPVDVPMPGKRSRKPLTEAQREAKRARDARYRAARKARVQA